jgi:hypothetical protein
VFEIMALFQLRKSIDQHSYLFTNRIARHRPRRAWLAPRGALGGEATLISALRVIETTLAHGCRFRLKLRADKESLCTAGREIAESLPTHQWAVMPSPAARRAHAPVIQRGGDGAERSRTRRS